MHDVIPFAGGNPLDEDIANYTGMFIFQSLKSGVDSEVLIDNFNVTPEPASLALLCLGWLALAKRSSRRQRHSGQ